MAKKPTTKAKAKRAEQAARRPFAVLDLVMQARSDMEGTLGIVDALLDAGELTEAAAETMRRHIATDWAGLVAATDAAWEALVVKRGAK